ncbi:P-loop containing nucleoside triphosphate hydrolase protein, partial [Saitoella complicata NRRL Y-17804]
MVESEAHSSPSIARSRPLGAGRPPRPPPPPQRPEKPTHHELDLDAAKRWIYPLNMTVRDYQFNIVQKALFHNVLCALPTGLGKTLIASVVMRNWYDWAPKSKVIFMAPTKPLIAQQLDACYKICGIPKSQTALMTGHTSVANRAEAYRTKRMFFCTPQTVENDIRNGYLDVKDIVCIVVDEAHRATGNYAYANVVRLLEGRGGMSRILALTATPGSTVEAVQQVIDNLHVSRIEIRSEDSLDIRQYVFKKTIDKVVVPLSDEIIELRDLYAKVLDVFLKKLNGANAFGLRDATALVPFSVMKAKEAWMRTPAAQQNPGMRNAYMSIFTLLASLAHPMMLLQQHGIRPFYTHLNEIQNETEGRGKKAGKLKSELIGNEDFRTLMRRVREMIGEPTYTGHPKMDRMSGLLLEHFMRAKDEGRQTRCIVFTNYRESADDILQTLSKHKPLVLPTMFHGQASAKDQAGMTQKEQIDIVDKFLKGDFNTLVATSIGEEGLDIGDVDLIVCYDSSASPIRMLQRQGRTGRKREGRAVVLVTEGKEDSNYGKALDNYKTMQRKIEQGNDFILQDEKSFRMLPRDVQPVCEKVTFAAPEEPEEPKTKGKKGREPKLKRPPKKFYMPDGVELGFQTVS